MGETLELIKMFSPGFRLEGNISCPMLLEEVVGGSMLPVRKPADSIELLIHMCQKFDLFSINAETAAKVQVNTLQNSISITLV